MTCNVAVIVVMHFIFMLAVDGFNAPYVQEMLNPCWRSTNDGQRVFDLELVQKVQRCGAWILQISSPLCCLRA